MAGAGTPLSRGLKLNRIEEVFEDHEIFSLESGWETEFGLPESRLSGDQRPETYRHIKSGNTTYALVSRSGDVKLCIGFIDQSIKPRGKIVPEVLRNYTYLAKHLKASGVEYASDEEFERAIDEAAESLEDLRGR